MRLMANSDYASDGDKNAALLRFVDFQDLRKLYSGFANHRDTIKLRWSNEWINYDFDFTPVYHVL